MAEKYRRGVIYFHFLLMHGLLNYGLSTVITTDTNFILTLTSDSGFVLNYEISY